MRDDTPTIRVLSLGAGRQSKVDDVLAALKNGEAFEALEAPDGE